MAEMLLGATAASARGVHIMKNANQSEPDRVCGGHVHEHAAPSAPRDSSIEWKNFRRVDSARRELELHAELRRRILRSCTGGA